MYVVPARKKFINQSGIDVEDLFDKCLHGGDALNVHGNGVIHQPAQPVARAEREMEAVPVPVESVIGGFEGAADARVNAEIAEIDGETVQKLMDRLIHKTAHIAQHVVIIARHVAATDGIRAYALNAKRSLGFRPCHVLAFHVFEIVRIEPRLDGVHLFRYVLNDCCHKM
ncbi:hypothetical protein Barb4_05577 [Bacteroidales bacterium Barb4]|nr:hypothetical protein Barb4_05577 [Bacteroidales bacterium Barb4]